MQWLVLRFTPPADPSEKGNQHICRGGMKIKAGLELRVDTAVPWCIQEPTVERRQHCSMQCGSLDERGVWGRMGTWMCMAESLPCSPETITKLLTGLKKKKKTGVLMSYHIAQGTLFSVMQQPTWEESSGKNQLSLVQFSHSVVSNSLRPHGLQHSRPPCPSPTPGVYSNSCPLSR